MFAALHRNHGTVAELARLLAAWLALLLLMQGFAALQTLVRGPAHRHVQVSSQAVQAEQVKQAQAHLEAHRRAGAHYHAAGDPPPLPAEGEAALDTAACVLLATLAPLAATWAWPLAAAGRAAAAGEPWAFLDRRLAPPRPPPRG